MTPEAHLPSAAARVSILARAVPALSYALPALGAAASAFLFVSVLRAMREAETAGIGAVAAAISHGNLAILVSLYLAIVVGLVGVVIGLVRVFTTTTTASPSAWFFFITGILGFAPVFTLWQAQSVLLGVLFSRSTGGVAAVAREISVLLVLSIVGGLGSVLILLVSAVVPLPRVLHAKRKWAPFVMLLVMQTAIVIMTILYHMRTAWLYNEYQKY